MSVDEASIPETTAIVIGGSIAGLLAAAALAPHFARVVVLDRDELPESKKYRSGVPHGYQFHGLSVGGRLAMEALLPGFTDAAVAEGAPLFDTSAETRFATKCGFLPRQPSSMRTLTASRPLLEAITRRETKKIDTVELWANTAVEGLAATDGTVHGVHYRGADSAGLLEAALVVDASGRASQAPKWLEEVGYSAPVETVINARWGYSTAYVRPEPAFSPDYGALYVLPTFTGSDPAATRGGATWKQEGGIWGITAQGCAGDLPPSDEQGIREWFVSIGADEIVTLMDRGELVSPVQAWRNTANRLRDFAALTRRPESFIVLGDAVAAFNPIYGMGMATAAIGASILGEVLTEWQADSRGSYAQGFAELFQKRLDTLIQSSWSSSTGADRQIRGVKVNGVEAEDMGPTPESELMDRVLALAVEDVDVAAKFMESRQSVRGPEWLADPALQARIRADWDRLGTVRRNGWED